MRQITIWSGFTILLLEKSSNFSQSFTDAFVCQLLYILYRHLKSYHFWYLKSSKIEKKNDCLETLNSNS